MNDDISIEELIEALNEPDNQEEIEGGRKLYSKAGKIYSKLGNNLMVDLEEEDIRNFINFIPCKIIDDMIGLNNEEFEKKLTEWIDKYNKQKEDRKRFWNKVSENGYGI